MVSMDICKDLSAIDSLRAAYLSSLRGPQEAWLEEQVHVRSPDFHIFRHGGQPIGFCCVDRSKHLLLQFHILDEFSHLSLAAFEMMLGTRAVSALIREAKTFQIPSIMQTSRALGMVTLNDSLLKLVREGLVEPKEAWTKTNDQAALMSMFKSAGLPTSFR